MDEDSRGEFVRKLESLIDELARVAVAAATQAGYDPASQINTAAEQAKQEARRLVAGCGP